MKGHLDSVWTSLASLNPWKIRFFPVQSPWRKPGNLFYGGATTKGKPRGRDSPSIPVKPGVRVRCGRVPYPYSARVGCCARCRFLPVKLPAKPFELPVKKNIQDEVGGAQDEGAVAQKDAPGPTRKRSQPCLQRARESCQSLLEAWRQLPVATELPFESRRQPVLLCQPGRKPATISSRKLDDDLPVAGGKDHCDGRFRRSASGLRRWIDPATRSCSPLATPTEKQRCHYDADQHLLFHGTLRCFVDIGYPGGQAKERPPSRCR